VLHGNRTYLLQDADGQILDGHSISAGLDYPGIGPEHSWLHDTGRVEALRQPIMDDEAL
jgi:tryptophan synthase beta chain